MYSIRQITFREINFPRYSRNIIALKKTTYTVYTINYLYVKIDPRIQTGIHKIYESLEKYALYGNDDG